MSSGLPPALNGTETLCLLLDLTTIASSFSEECGDAMKEWGVLASISGSDVEKSAIEDMCTADCIEKLIQFLDKECQNFPAAVSVGGSLLGLCAESGGVPCHYIIHHYNWTAVDTACTITATGLEEYQCSDKCSTNVLSAVETLGCCANYDDQLAVRTAACGLSIPEHCPDPFKAEEEDKEKEKDKTDNEGKPDDVRIGGEEVSNAVTLMPISALLSSMILFCLYLDAV